MPPPSPTPTPTPSPSPTPGPAPLPQLSVSENQNPIAGGECSTITATTPSVVSTDTLITFTVSPSSALYGFGSSPTDMFSNTATCTISTGTASCSTGDGGNLCAASGAVNSSFSINGSANGYASGTSNITVSAPSLSASAGCGYPLPGTDTASSCTAVTASIPSALSSNLTVTFSIPTASTGVSNYYFSSAYGGNTASTTDCTITAASTSCSSILLLCAGASSDNESVPVTVSATGYSESAATVSASNPKYIFITNAAYNGDLKTAGGGTDGYDGANKLCQAAASSGSVTSAASPTPVTWKAMLDTNNATKTCQYYKNTNNQVMGKATGGDFVGAAQIPNTSAFINWDENGAQISSSYPQNGGFSGAGGQHTCNNWTSSSSSYKGRFGDSSVISPQWWSTGEFGCHYQFNHVWCVQQ